MAALVFLLSLRLRQREIETMVKIGGSRGVIVSILATEIMGVILVGVLLAGLLTWFSSQYASTLIRLLLHS
jgi:putative ABC transport system permease protein